MGPMLWMSLRWRKLVDSLVEMARVSLDWTLSVKSTTRYLLHMHLFAFGSFIKHVLLDDCIAP